MRGPLKDVNGQPKAHRIDLVFSKERYQPGEEVEVVISLTEGFDDDIRIDWLLAQAHGEVNGLHGAQLNRHELSFRSPEEVNRPSINSAHGFVPIEQRLPATSALLYSTSPEILAVSFTPAASRHQVVYHFRLPHLLPPSFSGKYVSIRYYITVAASVDSTVFQSKTPMRVTTDEDGLNCVGRAVLCTSGPRGALLTNSDTLEDRQLAWAARRAGERRDPPATFGRKNFSISLNKSAIAEITVIGRWNPAERLLYVDLDSSLNISVKFSTTRTSTPTEHLRVRLVRAERPRDELAGACHRTAVAECVLPSVSECGLVNAALPIYVPMEETPSFNLAGAVKVSHQLVFDFFVGEELTRVTWTLNCRIVDSNVRQGGGDEETETAITVPLPFKPYPVSTEGEITPCLMVEEARGVRKEASDEKATIDCIMSGAQDSLLDGGITLHRAVKV
ncbi:hypothetical protein FOL47_005022 [Perkinsus chesapeaki]|uniref:Arrestin-like N-terminal domain-containing protein n=1 Tax=Perkinsus chesapeaki TaxID=330153 RepID=A0A7J6LZE7_PERCH|nr:hypothetical protein FOL47_005022 [Perkinsus chesapeaki]